MEQELVNKQETSNEGKETVEKDPDETDVLGEARQ